MAQFQAQTSIQTGILLLKLNGSTIVIDSGSTNINIPDNEHFVVQWFVKAVPNSTYSVKISSPVGAAVNISDKTIPSSGVDFGGFTFNT